VGLMTSAYARLQKRLRGAGEAGTGQMPGEPQNG
jgi:hypothetical protein